MELITTTPFVVEGIWNLRRFSWVNGSKDTPGIDILFLLPIKSRVTNNVNFLPLRITSIGILVPGAVCEIAHLDWLIESTFCESTFIIRSFCSNPATSAALSGTIFFTIAPEPSFEEASSTPRKPLRIPPLSTISVSTFLTILTGIANPIPILAPVWEIMAVLIPIRRPLASSKGPPELPLLIAASVWMKFSYDPSCSSTPSSDFLVAEIIPMVTVIPIPRGLPAAKTMSPTSKRSLLARLT